MELAAVVMVPDQNDFASINRPRLHLLPLRPLSSPLLPILGNDVLRTWTDRIRKLGVTKLWLTSLAERDVYSGLARLFQRGVERFLMVKLKSYAEMDLADVVRFHCQGQNSVTDVEDSKGQLGVSILDRAASAAASEEQVPSDILACPERAKYAFRGYAKRILSSKERQALIGDALTGACAMRPLGQEIRRQVWVGKGVSLADSAQVLGPTYIGDRTVVRAGAVVGPFASVERDCIVDCGTRVEESSVLPSTYIGPGLLIRRALVNGGHLEDLQRGVIADVEAAGLANRTRSRRSDARSRDQMPLVASHPWESHSSAKWQEVSL